MDRETATKIRDAVQEGADRIRSSVVEIRGHLSDQDFKNYCKVVGVILADVQLELLRPYVYSKFPELEPKPSNDAEREFIESLRPRFVDAAKRAREDDEGQ